jgi:hypothetical protein
MKAEERKHLKENELASRLGSAWQTIASGSTVNTIIWGVILLGLVLAVGWRYYADSAYRTRSALWTELANATSEEALQQIIKDHPGTITARIARFHLARFLMQDSLARLAGPNSEDRKKAADALDKVRTLYGELAREPNDEPTLTQEAMMGVAKAEETLASVPKANSEREVRGSIEEAIKAYRALADKYPDSFLGKQADKRARELTDHRTQVEAFYITLTKEHGKPPPLPTPPPLPVPPPPAIPSGPTLPEAPKAPEVKAPDAPAAPATTPLAGAPTPAPATPPEPPKGESKDTPKPDGEKPKGP